MFVQEYVAEDEVIRAVKLALHVVVRALAEGAKKWIYEASFGVI